MAAVTSSRPASAFNRVMSVVGAAAAVGVIFANILPQLNNANESANQALAAAKGQALINASTCTRYEAINYAPQATKSIEKALRLANPANPEIGKVAEDLTTSYVLALGDAGFAPKWAGAGEKEGNGAYLLVAPSQKNEAQRDSLLFMQDAQGQCLVTGLSARGELVKPDADVQGATHLRLVGSHVGGRAPACNAAVKTAMGKHLGA